MRRTFISIDLPEEVKSWIKEWEQPEIRWIKWMAPRNMHITLNFLGELRDENIELVKAVMAEVAANHQPFRLRLIKTKPERNMLWLMPEVSQELSDLRDELSKSLAEQGIYKRERRAYAPHILVAKTKKFGRRMTWQPKELEPVEFLVDKINLYESQLTPGAATHILLQAFRLGEVESRSKS